MTLMDDLINRYETVKGGYTFANLVNLDPMYAHALKGFEDLGEPLTNVEGLADVKAYANSAFDISKFSKTGNPTVTSDGIASGFSSSDYLAIPNLNILSTSTLRLRFKLDIPSTLPSSNIEPFGGSPMNYYFRLMINTSGVVLYAYDGTTVGSTPAISLNDYLGRTVCFDLTISNAKREVKVSLDGENWVSQSSTVTLNWASVIPAYYSLYVGKSHNAYWNGSIDLNTIQVYIDNTQVFSGSKTGVDTYTINGTTVEIPYKIASNNTKIADSSYRPQIQALYEQQGFAPYFTLSDTDFTVPVGQMYGMIGQRALINSYRNGETYYEVYSDNTIEQGGACTSGVEVTFPKAFKNTNYVITVPYTSKTTTSFIPSQSGTYIAKGEC